MKTAQSFEVPEAIEFGYCRIGSPEERKIAFTNRAFGPGRFAIVSEIFEFTPRQGKRCN